MASVRCFTGDETNEFADAFLNTFSGIFSDLEHSNRILGKNIQVITEQFKTGLIPSELLPFTYLGLQIILFIPHIYLQEFEEVQAA